MDASHRLASKGLFYEESAGVPLLMKYTGTIAPGTVDREHLVSTGLDILPTLCDYAGVDVPDSLLGHSLRSAAERRDAPNRRPYVVSENLTGRMIRTDRFKYCVYSSGEARESLVDMMTDPGEMNNLAELPDYDDVLAKHRTYLIRWIEESSDVEAKAFAISARP
jgi:arylsulfatase A-like enzyme